MSTGSVDVEADYLASVGDECGVCCRMAESCDGASKAIGRMTSVRLNNGKPTSLPVCADCAVLILTGDWSGIERLVFAYESATWSWWQSIVRRRHARRLAQYVARAAQDLFANQADPDDAPHERSAR